MKLTKEDIGVDIIDSYPYPLTRHIKYIRLDRLREVVKELDRCRCGRNCRCCNIWHDKIVELFGKVI